MKNIIVDDPVYLTKDNLLSKILLIIKSPRNKMSFSSKKFKHNILKSI